LSYILWRGELRHRGIASPTREALRARPRNLDGSTLVPRVTKGNVQAEGEQVSEHADQFEEREEEEQGSESGGQEGTEQGNRQSGSGPGSTDRQGEAIQDQPGATEDPSADWLESQAA